MPRGFAGGRGAWALLESTDAEVWYVKNRENSLGRNLELDIKILNKH